MYGKKNIIYAMHIHIQAGRYGYGEESTQAGEKIWVRMREQGKTRNLPNRTETELSEVSLIPGRPSGTWAPVRTHQAT